MTRIMIRESANSPAQPSEEKGQAPGGTGVSLRNVAKTYGDVNAVHSLNLEVRPGELLTLLGPSGSGKTTTLMMVAGFTDPSAGDILIGPRPVAHLPPHKRDVGVVFQHYALFPHMTVNENIAFPLQMRGRPPDEIAEKVRKALDLVQMPAFGHRFPAQLSGGQQQRVAFARAIVFDPPVLLLDEPLGALDKKLRESMQVELKALHAKLGLTMIYVTHDQAEALALSDRVAVMNEGKLEQVGTPQDLYERPASAFVADFVGESNFLTGRAEKMMDEHSLVVTEGGLRCRAKAGNKLVEGAVVKLMVRPERVYLGDDTHDMPNQFDGELNDVSYVGDCIKYRVAITPRETVTAKVQNRGGMQYFADRRVRVGWKAEDVFVFSVD